MQIAQRQSNLMKSMLYLNKADKISTQELTKKKKQQQREQQTKDSKTNLRQRSR